MTTPYNPEAIARQASVEICDYFTGPGIITLQKEQALLDSIILSAMRQAVKESGAIPALELTEQLSPDMPSTREAAVAAMTALDNLRKLTEGGEQP